MAITTLPTIPQRSDPSTFVNRTDTFLSALDTFQSELNTTAGNINTYAQQIDTSNTTSLQDASSASTKASEALSSEANTLVSKNSANASEASATASAGTVMSNYDSITASSSNAKNSENQASASALAASNLVSGVSTNRPSIRPSLLLNFANSRVLDPRITFTRNSVASYIDSNGLVTLASPNEPRFDYDPITRVCRGLLIEEARTNLLKYTNDLQNWNKGTNTNFVIEGISPIDSVSNHYSISSTGSAGNLFLNTSITVPSTGTYTASAWVKVDDASLVSSGSRLLSPNINGVSTYYLTYAAAGLTVGVWKRVNYSFSATAGDIITFNFGFDFSTSPSVKLYFCNPQLEQGSSPTSYIPSTETFTSRASSGSYIGSNGLIQSAITNVARYNYNPLNLTLAPKLLLEEARTNLLTYSEQFDNANWPNTARTILANNTTAPDGTLTADKVIVNNGQSASWGAQLIPELSTGTYTLSVFLKDSGGGQASLYFYSTEHSDNWKRFNLVDGSLIANYGPVSTAGTHGSVSLGNGWFRFWFTFTTTGMTNFQCGIRQSDWSGDGVKGYFQWGAQLEAGAYPTSYIATTSAQVTRAADVSSSAQTTRAADLVSMTGTNFSSWYRQDEGTFVAEMFGANSVDSSGGGSAFSVSDGTPSNFLSLGRSFAGSTNRFEYNICANGTGQVYFNPGDWLAGASAKLAGAYKTNDASFSPNGTTPLTDTSVTVPTVNRMYLGANMYGSSGFTNGHIKCIAYYPKRLSNTELQALTA